MNVKCHLFLALLMFSYSQTLLGQERVVENPLSIIKIASTKMIAQLNLKQKDIAGNSSIVMDIVENVIMPNFAVNTISRKVLGKHARKITKAQKKQFTEAFRFYMVRFYSKLFSAYSNETFEYLASPNFIGKKKVTVKTRFIQTSGRPIPIDYKMQRSGDSWKIIDLKIEGISMVISNRSQFGNSISRDGIDTVIAKLEYKNKKAHSNE